MKVHRVLFQAVAETLQKIFEENVYADQAVEQTLKQNPSWGSRDRRFIAENTYEIVRWWRLVKFLAGEVKENDFFLLVVTWYAHKNVLVPEWPEFKAINRDLLNERFEKSKQERRVFESVPDWLDQLALEELGELRWEKEIHFLNQQAPVVLRVNILKSTRKIVEEALEKEDVEVSAIEKFPEALILAQRKNLRNLESYKKGWFEIQDASSQLVAPFLEVKPGMKVIDACAGAGGKSLHIAALMENQGSLLSMDVEKKKLTELETRAKRAGVRIIKTDIVSPEKIKALKNTADRLLLDVPCSGLGVLRRNPDDKWKLKPEIIKELLLIQQGIISNYCCMVKPGGIMVYATCSILPSENEEQVKKFLEKNSEFQLIEEKNIMPSEGYDGFYMAKLKKI